MEVPVETVTSYLRTSSPKMYANGRMDWISPNHFQNEISFEPNDIQIMPENQLSMPNSSQHQLRSPQPPSRKRAAKAPTMSAKQWKPAETRIEQLYVYDDKSIRELRETVNNEFGFVASERQYKSKIQQMKLQRNVKAKERTTIVQRIRHRDMAGKKSRLVRVRGRKITSEKLFRWMKEMTSDPPSRLERPLSATPSYISIYTKSYSEPSVDEPNSVFDPRRSDLRSKINTDTDSTIVQRLFAPPRNRVINGQEAGTVFNDLQFLLGYKCKTTRRSRGNQWNPAIEEDIIGLRNLMNLTRSIAVCNGAEDPRSLQFFPNQCLGTVTIRGSHRHAAWVTPYGQVEVSFWQTVNGSLPIITNEPTTKSLDKAWAAKVVLVPRRKRASAFRVVFDFTPRLDPLAKVTYQAIVPNDSEVFRLVRENRVKELIEALKKGTAHLTDRNEKGRSLLSYAVSNSCVEMCNFLLGEKADPNAIELNQLGFIGPIYDHGRGLDEEIKEEQRNRKSQCLKLMLERGADMTLERHGGRGLWMSCFADAVMSRSTDAFRHILNLGDPFINLNAKSQYYWNQEHSPLTALAKVGRDPCGGLFHIVDKVILLLQRKADISCRDHNGGTVCHSILRPFDLWSWGKEENRFYQFITEPKELLMVFITAGADVYATNYDNESPSLLALKNGWEQEWAEALTSCGFDPREVFMHSHTSPRDCAYGHQTSRLSFEAFCQQRQEVLKFKQLFFEKYCRGCGDKFRPDIVSFPESCRHCGEKFRPSGVPLDERHQCLREQYEIEKASWINYVQRGLEEGILRVGQIYFRIFYNDSLRQFQLKRVDYDSEDEESDYNEKTDYDDESDQHNECDPQDHDNEPSKEDEHPEMDLEPTNFDPENMPSINWIEGGLQEGGWNNASTNFNYEEASSVHGEDFSDIVNNQGTEHGDGGDGSVEQDDWELHCPTAEDQDITDEFFDFSSFLE